MSYLSKFLLIALLLCTGQIFAKTVSYKPGTSPKTADEIKLNTMDNADFRLDLTAEKIEDIKNKKIMLLLEVDSKVDGTLAQFPEKSQQDSEKGLTPIMAFKVTQTKIKILPITSESDLVLNSILKTKKIYGLFKHDKKQKKTKERTLSIKVYYSNKVLIDMDSDIDVDTAGLTELPILVRAEDSIDVDERIRLQFSGDLGTGKANFFGYGKTGNIATTGHDNFDFKLTRFTKQYVGFILDKNKEYFCKLKDCTFSVTLLLNNINSITSLCRIVPKLSTLLVNSFDFDYIQNNGSRLYVYTPTNEENVVVNIIPIEGDVKLYVHPGSYPNQMENSTWKVTSSLAKRLIITKEERKDLLVTDTTLFITVSSDSTSSYVISIRPFFEGDGNIQPGYIESGSLVQGEVKNHVMIIESTQATFNDFLIRLHLLSGDAELYFKACPNYFECEITVKDLKLSNSMNFKKALNSGSEKEIRFPVFCNKGDPTAEIQPEMLNSYGVTGNNMGAIYKSPSCAFVVGVRSAPASAQLNTTNSRCHYELSVEEENTDHLLNEKHPLLVRALPEQYKYYKFHLQHAYAEADSFEIHVDSMNGFHEVCIHKGDDRPKTDFKDCFLREAFNSNNLGLYTNYKTLSVTKKLTPDKTLEGIYYIVIHSFSYTSVYQNAVIKRHTDMKFALKHTGPKYYKHLKAGSIISDRIDNPFDQKLFNFTVHLDDTDSNSLTINLIPIKGKFKFAVRNDGKEPSLDQSYWITDDNHLLITSDSPLFKRQGEYTIAVWSVVSEEVADSYTDLKSKNIKSPGPLNYQFKIRYSHLGKHVVMTPGHQEVGTLESKSQCFIAMLHNDHKEVSIFKSMATMVVNMYVSLDENNQRPDETLNFKKADSHTVGVFLGGEEISKACGRYFKLNNSCHMYVCLEGPEHSYYSLTYSHDSLPFQLRDGEAFYGPLILHDEDYINFIYHSVPGKPLDIEEYSGFSYVQVYSKLIEGSSVNVNQLKFPTKANYEKIAIAASNSSMIHYTEEETKKFKDPVALISVTKSQMSLVNAGVLGKYNTSYFFSLQVTHELTYIEKGISKTGYVKLKEWKFFTFYNDDKKNTPIMIDVEPMDNGDPDLYLVQGKNNRPTTSQYLMKSSNFKGDHQVVTIKDLQKVGLKEMTGYYVIGVWGFKETKFSQKWRHSSTTITNANFNKPIFLDLKEKKPQHIELFHYMWKAPVTFKIAANHAHVILLVNKHSKENNEDYFESYPTLDDHELRINLTKEQSMVKKTLEIDDPNFCDNCRYLMTIITPEPGAHVEFLATYQSNFSYVNLENGKQLIDMIDANSEEKYRVELPHGKASPDIDVNILHGDVEFFSGSNILMSSTNFNWKLELNEGRNFIKLSNSTKADGPASPGFLGAQQQFGTAIGGYMFTDVYLVVKCLPGTSCMYKIQVKQPGDISEFHSGITIKSTAGKNETDIYTYPATGKEEKIEIFFKALGVVGADPTDLDKSFGYYWKAINSFQVYHTSDKADLESRHFGYPMNAEQVSYLHGNSVVKTFNAKPGYYSLVYNNIADKAIHYSVELVTNQYRMIEVGQYVIDYLNQKTPVRYYELHIDEPGYIYLDFSTCLSNIKVYFNDQGLEESSEGVETFKKLKGKDNRYDKDQSIKVDKAGPIFIKVRKPVTDVETDDFSTENNSKDIYGRSSCSVFSFEVYYHKHHHAYPFKGVYPSSNGQVNFELGSNPVVTIDPVTVKPKLLDDYKYKITYHLIMSPSPKEIQFKSNCDTMFHDFMPENFRDEIIEEVKETDSDQAGSIIIDVYDENAEEEDENDKEEFAPDEERKQNKLKKSSKKKSTKKLIRSRILENAKSSEAKTKVNDATEASKTSQNDPLASAKKAIGNMITQGQDMLKNVQNPIGNIITQGHDMLKNVQNPITGVNTSMIAGNMANIGSKCCTFHPKLKPGTRYYGKVYVSLWAIPKNNSAKAYNTKYIRQTYDDFVQVTPHFMFPFEYFFVGLVVMAIVSSMFIIGKRWLKRVSSRMMGWRTVSVQEEMDIDAKLEEFFLSNKSKFEEQHPEFKDLDISDCDEVKTEERKKEVELSEKKEVELSEKRSVEKEVKVEKQDGTEKNVSTT